MATYQAVPTVNVTSINASKKQHSALISQDNLFVTNTAELYASVLTDPPWMISLRYLDDAPELQLYLFVTNSEELYASVLTVRPLMISQTNSADLSRFSDDLPKLQLYPLVTISADLYPIVLTVRTWMISQRFLKDLADLQLQSFVTTSTEL